MEEQFVPCPIANVNVMRERARRSAGGREVSINSSAIHCSIAAGYTNERSEGGKSSEALRAPSSSLLLLILPFHPPINVGEMLGIFDGVKYAEMTRVSAVTDSRE